MMLNNVRQQAKKLKKREPGGSISGTDIIREKL